MADSVRRGLRPPLLLGAALVGSVATGLQLRGARLTRVFVDFDWPGFRTGWALLVVVVLVLMLGALVTGRVIDQLARPAGAVAFLLLSVVLAAGGIDDPAMALAVGVCLGALAAVAGFLVWGMEGEGGVVWLGAITAGCFGIVFGAFVGGSLDAAAKSGSGLATVLSEFFGLTFLGVFGAVPAGLVLWAGERLLQPYENHLLNVLGGLLAGALLTSAVVG